MVHLVGGFSALVVTTYLGPRQLQTNYTNNTNRISYTQSHDINFQQNIR